jgi:transcriptional regulator with XRE-family HTH domain
MSEDVRRMVGENVRRLRIAAGLNQAELAARMGVDRSYISGLERGARNPTIVTLWHAARALGAKLRDLTREPRQSSLPSRRKERTSDH